jgi:HD-like signal output (HDOD) protein
MHPQPNPGSDPDVLAHAILGLLTEDHPGLWSIADVDRALRPSNAAATGSTPTRDAIEALYAAGLLNRVGDCVFASRAAHEAQRLAG